MNENRLMNEQDLGRKYIELKEKTGFTDNSDVAEAYLDRFPIDTRHSAVWKEFTPIKEEDFDDEFQALGIREGDGKAEFYLLGEYEGEDEAKKAVKECAEKSGLEVDDKLLDIMVLKFHKHQIYTGGNARKKYTIQNVNANMEIESTQEQYKEIVSEKLDELEQFHNLDSLIAKGYTDAGEYELEGKNLRSEIIGNHISELNNEGIYITKDNIATYDRIDHKDKRKPLKFVRTIKSSTIDMSLCIAVIDFLAERVSDDDNAAEILSKSHEWRIGKGFEEKGSLRKSISNLDKIGANEKESLTLLIGNMIENQFDIQPLISTNGRCIGCLELKSLSKEMAVYGYSRMGEQIDFNTLDSLGLIGDPPVIINATHGLHWFSRLLSDNLDALLFDWDPEESPRHKKIHDERNPKLETGLHIITSHDILAYVEQKNRTQ